MTTCLRDLRNCLGKPKKKELAQRNMYKQNMTKERDETQVTGDPEFCMHHAHNSNTRDEDNQS